MIGESIQTALNKQINEDHHSCRLYLSMAAHCEGAMLHGFSKRFRKEGHESLARAEKIVHYMTRHGNGIRFEALEAPKATWDSPLALLQDAHEREHHVSDCIGKLVDLALSEGDNATACFLQRFVSKQTKEEALMARLIEQLKLVGDTPAGLFLLDRHVA